ncbi:uncharacterized protein [Dendropsophus ebraccatus]|uniref:uncharacterized protein n=1 Tax=Dendropsophus ebraccatus TaxID=150705 RepID=UPI0038311EFD
MENTLGDDQGPEQEAVGSQKSVTSTCGGTKQTDSRDLSYATTMELDSDLLDNLQPLNMEMLTNEIVNPGTQASVTPCHKESSQGSHDTSPSNDDPHGICNAILLGELESSHAVEEMATGERHVHSETRPLKEENETPFKEIETSSDETDDWETASEESVKLNPEAHGLQRDREDTGSYGQEKHNEDTESPDTKTVSEDGQKTVSEDTRHQTHETVSEDNGPHGKTAQDEEAEPRGLETLSEDTEHHSHEKVSEDTEHHSHKKVSEDTEHHSHKKVSEDTEHHSHKKVSEDTEHHSHEKVSEDTEHHGHEKVSEDTEHHSHKKVSEDTEHHDHEKVSEDTEHHDHEKVSEDTEHHDHEKVSEDTEHHDHEKVSEDTEHHGHEKVSEDTEHHGHAKVSEDTEHHGHAKVSEDTEHHDHEKVSEDTEHHDHAKVSEDTELHGHRKVSAHFGHEAVGEDSELSSHETVSEDAGVYDQERMSEDTGHHSQEMYSEEAGPHRCETVTLNAEPPGHELAKEATKLHDDETVSEDAGHQCHDLVGEEAHDHNTVNEESEPHSHGTIREEVEPNGLGTVCKEIEPQGLETVSEEAGPHGHETLEASPHSQEIVNYVIERHGLEPVTKETLPFDLEMSRRAAEPLSHGNMGTDNREATLHSQDTSHDVTQSYDQETCGPEKVNEEAGPHDQELDSEDTGSCGAEKTETIGGLDRSHIEETVRESVRPLSDGVVSDITRPHSSNADIEIQDYEEVSGMKSEECDKDQALNDVIVTVNKATTDEEHKKNLSTERKDENYMLNSIEIPQSSGDELKTVSNYDEDVGEGTHVGHPETDAVHLRTDYKETSKSVQETSDFEYTKVDNMNASMGEIFERISEVQIAESSIEEKEEKQTPLRSNQNCELLASSKASRTLDESATEELDNHNPKQKWDLAEASNEHKLSGVIEIAYLECERLEEKPHSIKTLVGTGEGISEDLPDSLNQESVLKFQYNTPVTTDERSYMGCTMDIDSQDVSGSLLMEKKGQGDHSKPMSDSETKSIEPEYKRTSDTQNEPYNNLGFGYYAEPEVKVVSSDDQDIGEPYLQLSGSFTEQSTNSTKVDLSACLQNKMLGHPEPPQQGIATVDMLDLHSSPVDQSSPEICRDEPDHYKLNFFPMTLQEVTFVPEVEAELGSKIIAPDLLPESIDTELAPREEATQLPLQESIKEAVHQESILGDIHPVFGVSQDAITPDSETAKTSATDVENIKLVRRQRSNTDPLLIHDQDEKLQDISNTEGSSRSRLRSITPPFDRFTSSYTSSVPQTLEQTTSSVFYPVPNENKNSHCEKDTTSGQEHTFYPTQIFNPMLLLGHSIEESGFYQEESFRQDHTENTSQGQSPPMDNQVRLRTQNPERVVKESSTSRKSEENYNFKPLSTPLVSPLWLPPQPTRYTGSSNRVNEVRSMIPSENPLVRRATIRHKKSNVGAKPTTNRFSNTSLPAIPQKDYPTAPRTCNFPRVQPMNVNSIQISSKNRSLARQQKIPEEMGKSKPLPSVETVREEGLHTKREKPSQSPESVLLRGSRSRTKPPSLESSMSMHRRYSTFINSSNLLYQEYSDVALNQEIQRQKPGDSPAEENLPSSPRVRRRILSSQNSYLQRLSVSSADSLWQDIPKIRDSVTFMSMTREEQKLQEAKFELIMSEALYLRSLNIAVDHFQRNAELQEILSAQDRQWLFSRLSEVRDASADFLFDLEEEFESNMYNFQVCDVVINHEPNFRRVYRPYVTNQSYQDRTYQTLINGNPRFQQVLAKLESDPVCQRLSLKSFLILPFQRITRLRLLLQNILKRSAPGSTEELQATEAHNALEKLIRDCNESVQRMKDTEELILLNQKIQFECKIFPLISQSRRLVKHGEVTSLEFNSMSIKWKVTTRPVYLHLFNDCLLLSRVREGGRFIVFDHSSEFRVERCEIKLHTNQKNIFRVFLRDSAAMGRESSPDARETAYIFRTETQSQKLRWICALSPPKQEIDFIRNHGLSQMQCLKSYKARENDELSLEKADIVMITQNSDDGWLHGIRLSDQQSGWFPQSHVQPLSRDACIRNLEVEQRLQTARAKMQPTDAKGQ